MALVGGNQYTTKGQEKRRRLVAVRYTDSEHAKLVRLADAAEEPISDFIRRRSLIGERRTREETRWERS